jgi:hypothetical protein
MKTALDHAMRIWDDTVEATGLPSFFRWLRQSFCDHNFEPYGGPYRIGYTTAPFPAVDEWEQESICRKCGKRKRSYAGFVFESEDR